MNGWGPFHIREITPKDFYLAQILRNENKSLLPIFLRVIINDEVLEVVPSKVFKSFVNWAAENIFNDNILTVENWLEVAFHLNKQRWGPSIDWLETQPMSKIKTMIEINKKHVEEQESQVKKAGRKK